MNCFSDKSDEAWNAAEELISKDLSNSAANRMYYAVFQSVFGFAIKQGILQAGDRDKIHSKVQKVAEQKGDALDGFAMSTLWELRRKGDYYTVPVKKADLKNIKDQAGKARNKFLNK